MEKNRHLLKSAGAMGLMTAISRIFGLIRDIFTTMYLGTGTGADAFNLAYRIPNLLRRLVAEGTMTAAFVPVFTEYSKKNSQEKMWDFANKFFFTLTLILAVAAVIGIIFARWIVKVIGFGFKAVPGKIDLTTSLTQIMFFYLLFIGLAALAMAILNSFDIFAAPAFTPVLLNIAIIAAAYFLSPRFKDPSYAFAIGVLIGGFLQIAFQIPFLVKKGMRFRPRISLSHPAIRKVGLLMVPGFFGVGIIQINVFISTIIASSLAEGSVSSLIYANRITEFVLGIFAVSISTVILPLMSRQVIDEGIEAMKRTLSYALRLIFYITIPATVGLIILRVPIIRVLFQRGRFDSQSVEMTAYPLIFFGLGLSIFAAIRVIAPSFYSLKDTKTPVKTAAAAMVANVILALILITPFQHGGIALALTLSSCLNLFLLLYIFQKRHGRIGKRELLISLVKIAIASLVMGAVCWWLTELTNIAAQQRFLTQLWQLIMIILASVACYVIMTLILRSEETKELLGVIFRREITLPKD